jgi:hypothetical protein
MSSAYDVKAIKSGRDGIHKTKAQIEYTMPPPGSMIIVGRSGSGKSTLVHNLLSRREMLRGYFDRIYLFCLAPCNIITRVPGLRKEDVFSDDDPERLQALYDFQRDRVKTVGINKAKSLLFIMDDIVQSRHFMNSQVLRSLFFTGTHSKCSVWILSQSYMAPPRALRINAYSMIICHGMTGTEIDRFCAEYQSAYLSKDDFRRMVEACLTRPYSFMFINNTIPNKKKQFRCGFGEVLVIP